MVRQWVRQWVLTNVPYIGASRSRRRPVATAVPPPPARLSLALETWVVWGRKKRVSSNSAGNLARLRENRSGNPTLPQKKPQKLTFGPNSKSLVKGRDLDREFALA